MIHVPYNVVSDERRSPATPTVVYLRRSREKEDAEQTLEVQREIMEHVVERYGFVDVEWIEEVASGESLHYRPKFLELLGRIEEGEIKTILVAHLDRLGRGDALDAAIIQDRLTRAGALVITPSQEYDYTQESTLLVTGIESVIAANERRKSIKKMIEAKQAGVRNGKLHSGSVPFPYEYTKGVKDVTVNPEKFRIYELMKTWFLVDGLSCRQIANKLNDMKVQAPTGRQKRINYYWYGKTVLDILTNRFHLGYIAYGKNAAPTDYYIQEYIEGMGDHERTKTLDEHNAILERVEELRTSGQGAAKVIRRYRLQTLVKCPYCGRSHTISFEDCNSPFTHVKKCLARSKNRKPECNTTRGIKEDILYNAVMRELKDKYDEIFEVGTGSIDDKQEQALRAELEAIEESIQKVETRKERTKEMYKEGFISMDELRESLEKESETLNKLNVQAERIRNSTAIEQAKKKERRVEMWSSDDVFQLFHNAEELDDGEINEILKTIIDGISYTIDDEKKEINIEITYK